MPTDPIPQPEPVFSVAPLSTVSRASSVQPLATQLVTTQMLEHGAQELNGYVDKAYASREAIAEKVFLAMLAVMPKHDPDNTMTPEFLQGLNQLRKASP